MDTTQHFVGQSQDVGNEEVSLCRYTLRELLNNDNQKLKIPDYQRIYCWEKKHVFLLLDDVVTLEGAYRLGSVILHEHDNCLDIIDGQQRLVTLSLILLELGFESRLLDECFESSEAQQYIAYNKYLIHDYIARNIPAADYEEFREHILDLIEFNVLYLHNTSIDLAYTFFSNENSKGVKLTDFDLLKAHHLRYIGEYKQQEHLATRWDSMLLDGAGYVENDRVYFRVLALYIFRLRKWMRKHRWNEYEEFKVKAEFEAAPIIIDIPPFGEKFVYNEPIQGGTHFFSYVEHFNYSFKNFCVTKEYERIHDGLKTESHSWFRDVIEAFLFAYYMKFGEGYLGEALLLIARYVSQYRLETNRVNYGKVLEKAGESEIVLMIDQASSPTFFLAELMNEINDLVKPKGESGAIVKRYMARMAAVLKPFIDKTQIAIIKEKMDKWIQDQLLK